MKVLITGAHFTPAQAVIEELKKEKNIEIVYVGRNSTLEGDKTPSVESQVLPQLGVKFYPIIAGRLRRFISLGTVISLLKVPIGFIQSFYIIVVEQPDVVLSFGGYVAVPVVISAWLFNIPIVVHEQTLVSGLANKISSLFASKIAVSFDKKYSFSKDKLVLTGNPIRPELFTPANTDSSIHKFLKRAGEEKKPVIYITGGNQGSHNINQSVSEVLEQLTDIAFVVHQTGDSRFKDFEKLSELREQITNKERYLPTKWVNTSDLSQILEKVDLVISRAGANTLYELAFFGIPTLVVPIPYLYADEQNVNAKFFANHGLCDVLPQKELTGENLLSKIKDQIKNKEENRKRAAEAKSLVIPNAAQRITLEVLTLSHV